MFVKYSVLHRAVKRYSLFVFSLFLILVLLFTAIQASAQTEPKTVKFLNQKPEQYIRARPATTTTTTTTTTIPPVKPVITAPKAPVVVPSPVPMTAQEALIALKNCESGGNYQRNSGNGYYGAYQFSIATWNSMGTGYARADLAPPEVQDDAAYRLQIRAGFHSQFPGCSRKLGLPLRIQ